MVSASAQIAGAFSVHGGMLFRLKAEGTSWRETTPLLGSGSIRQNAFLPPNHPLSPAPLGAAAPRPVAVLRTAYRVLSCSHCSHFCTLRYQKPSKLAVFTQSARVFVLQKYFRCLPSAFLGFKSTFVASPARFRASKAFSRLPQMRFRASKVLSRRARRVLGLQKHFRGFPGAFSRFKSTLPQCCALLTEFLLARTACIFAALRQKTQKLVVFIQVEQKSS